MLALFFRFGNGMCKDGYKAANETLARSTKESSSLSISRSLAVETDDVCETIPNKISIEMRDVADTPRLLALNT